MKRRTIVVIGCLGLFGVLGTNFVFDWWRVHGSVVDAQTNQPIGGALILLNFLGSEFRPIADTTGLDSICMGSKILTSDEAGGFLVDERIENWRLTNKRVKALVFKPGYKVAVIRTSVSVSYFSDPVEVVAHLDLSAVTEDFRPQVKEVMFSQLATIELAISEGNYCGNDSWKFMLTLFDYARAVAETSEEKEAIKFRCEVLRGIAALPRSQREKTKFLYECDDSLFEVEP